MLELAPISDYSYEELEKIANNVKKEMIAPVRVELEDARDERNKEALYSILLGFFMEQWMNERWVRVKKDIKYPMVPEQKKALLRFLDRYKGPVNVYRAADNINKFQRNNIREFRQNLEGTTLVCILGYVVGLSFQGYNEQATLDVLDSFKDLSTLMYLDVSESGLVRLPDSIKKWKLLRYIYLDGTHITSLPNWFNPQTYPTLVVFSSAKTRIDATNITRERFSELEKVMAEKPPGKTLFAKTLQNIFPN